MARKTKHAEAAFTFEEPIIKVIDQIISELKDSCQYSSNFIKSVAIGLRRSEYFRQSRNRSNRHQRSLSVILK